MPSLHTQVYTATRGRKDAQTLKTLPPEGWRREVQNRPDTQDLHHRDVKGPDPLSSVIDCNGTVRGVLPIKGIPGTTPHQALPLRPQPVPYQGSLYPKSGIARHQAAGLAYSEEKPLNRMPLQVASSFAADSNNNLGQPN
jgi:hypothetical protein